MLALAGALSRMLGMLYIIPLPRIIADEGMGLLQMVKPVYFFAFVVATAGLAVAALLKTQGWGPDGPGSQPHGSQTGPASQMGSLSGYSDSFNYTLAGS